jgi:hypothetical protein
MSVTPPVLTGRAAVRDTLSRFIFNPPVQNLNQVFTSFPKIKLLLFNTRSNL